MTLSTRPSLALLLAGLVFAVAGCTPGADQQPAGPETPASEVNTDPASMGEVTLTVWDQETRPAMNDHMEELNRQFSEKYPNIKIERVSRSFDDLRKTLRLAITNKKPPDVVQANNGRADLGQFVSSGLVTNLDPYAEAYGWADRYPESVRSLSSYSTDGKQFGTGSLWGLPITGELVGLWYNKAKLADLRIEPPTTTSEFAIALEQVKAAGEVPIQFGNLDGWPGIHEFGFVQNGHVPADQIRTLAFGAEGASWETPENTQAAETFADWAKRGNLTKDFNGLGYDAAWQKFAEGEGVFLIAGTWLLNEDLPKALGDDLGFSLPPAGASGQQVVTGGPGLPFAITKASEHADAAAAYIDFIASAESMAGIAAAEGLPVVGGEATQSEGVQREVIDAWAKASSEELLVPYLDYATPDSYDLLVAQVQKLGAGSATPQDFLAALEENYSEFVAQNK